MSIYRGPGGAGDAVNDASSEVTLVASLVTEAEAAQAAAEAAQVAAELAETNAETAETNAETAEANAETAQAAAEAAQALAEAASDASINMAEGFDVEVSTLTAGSSATASYNNLTYLLSLGIPRGNTGATGSTGATGAKGDTGDTGNGIDNITRTSGTGAPGTTDTYTITYTDTTTDTFTVYQGADGTGAVSSVTGTAPVVSSGGANPAISMAKATTSVDGYLSATDWNTFNNKQAALTAGYGDTTNPYASKTANYILAAPNGSSGSPTFRALVASDIPTLNQNTTGTADNVTGTVAIANGGTGQTTKAAAFNALAPVTSTGDLIVGNGSNSSTRLAIGTSGYLLTSNGTTATWAAAPVSLPSQTGHGGEYLTTDGTTASWSTVSAGGSATNGIFQNATTVSTNETISSGNNGFSIGPMTVASGVSVTIASGQRWVVL